MMEVVVADTSVMMFKVNAGGGGHSCVMVME